jgi:fatty acid synthase subunit alpha
MGRTPREMSRPATSSRAGFMEAQGAGNQILVSASLAIKMGLPIYGIIAHVCTATDKEGRSLPAPGQGILTTAREITSPTSLEPMLLNFAYRQQQIQAQSAIIDKQLHEAIQKAKEVCKSDTLSYDLHVNELRSDSQRKLKALIRYYGHEFYHKDPRISPLKGALSVYNLTVDDIGVVSFHGTGTKANDLNESQILQTKMAHLGREPGHVCPGVFQKYLTGHPKAAAGSFMLNGILQILQYNIIPGNRNADNIDAAFENFDYILYPSRTLYPAHKIRAALLQCFGFGLFTR